MRPLQGVFTVFVCVRACVCVLFVGEGVGQNSNGTVFTSGEQGNKRRILRGTGEQRQYLGNPFIIIGDQGDTPLLFQGNRFPQSLGGHQ